MYVSEKTVDDLMRRVFARLLRARPVTNTRGDSREVVGAMLRLRNPRARLSRTEQKGKLFSCMGELLWYLSGSDSLEFVSYYLSRYQKDSDDGKTIFGAYGPRLLGGPGRPNQLESVTKLLSSSKASSRRAVVQLFEPNDIVGEHRKEVPCTNTLQFLVRRQRLFLIASMRSNDAYYGLPHDVFAFTMLQEIMARALNLELGSYTHMVGSLHLYESRVDEASRYLSEGWQETVEMPAMPIGDPWPEIKKLIKLEASLRAGGNARVTEKGHSYWGDLSRILQVYAVHCHETNAAKAHRRLTKIRAAMSSPVYDTYIERRQRAVEPAEKPAVTAQLPLFDGSVASQPEPTS